MPRHNKQWTHFRDAMALSSLYAANTKDNMPSILRGERASDKGRMAKLSDSLITRRVPVMVFLLCLATFALVFTPEGCGHFTNRDIAYFCRGPSGVACFKKSKLENLVRVADANATVRVLLATTKESLRFLVVHRKILSSFPRDGLLSRANKRPCGTERRNGFVCTPECQYLKCFSGKTSTGRLETAN